MELSVNTVNVCPPTLCKRKGCSLGALKEDGFPPSSIFASSSFRVNDTWQLQMSLNIYYKKKKNCPLFSSIYKEEKSDEKNSLWPPYIQQGWERPLPDTKGRWPLYQLCRPVVFNHIENHIGVLKAIGIT